MEKSQTELLQEFQEEIARLKKQIEALEDKISALQAAPVQAEDDEVDFTDIQIGVAEMPDPVGHDDQPGAQRPRGSGGLGPQSVEDSLAKANAFVIPSEASVSPEILSAPEEPRNDKPAFEPEPEAPKASAPKAEDDTAHLPWRTDKPGIPVKNIRSGISLLDRALFIGTLFKEDFALYDQTIAELNAMSSLDEAVDYIREKFPHWNLKSDVVYHFMMSVRKKLG